jgi:hypothetical protein
VIHFDGILFDPTAEELDAVLLEAVTSLNRQGSLLSRLHWPLTKRDELLAALTHSHGEWTWTT